jgi:1,4-dihydroxy-2-naphthoate octaprenyltransferase
MATIAIWVQAMRPRTLPAAVVPVAVGTALVAHGHPRWVPACACLAGSLLIQIGCNFANDAFDALSGADNDSRVGPRRAVAAGLISVRAMLWATTLVLGMAFLVGLYLTAIGSWPVLLLGLVSMLCAVAYTGGPYPLAYHGLGEAFVFLFFGLAAVLGSSWVQWRAMIPSSWVPSLAQMESLIRYSFQYHSLLWLVACAVGLQCTAIIAVNNLRDRVTDSASGKRTLAVRLGEHLARCGYGLIHLLAVVCLVAVAWQLHGRHPVLAWMPALAGLLGGVALTRGVFTTSGMVLNRYLARSAALEMLTGALLVIVLSI